MASLKASLKVSVIKCYLKNVEIVFFVIFSDKGFLQSDDEGVKSFTSCNY